ncbi:MAG: TonB-dependent receptor plug domain-containing protein [Treponema sp.]|jgi:hypothetical protein|nr:TonB-dependent receptor plug domain-containing protein [Treponema sp.]
MSIIKPVILCLLFCSAIAFGNAVTVTVTVIDEELEIPLEGATVVSWDGKELFCDSAGRVVLEVPGDRPVAVRISYPGYEGSRVVLRPGVGEYTATLRLGGAMEAQELVIEATRPGSSETVSGQSVAISGRELARQSETGILEDVMRAVKLLSGVGYAGDYATLPSIRGGEPEDITAVFDGFYVERPFHWGGAFSIFDPKMVESAQVSHGVFSARYGHTISGLLDIHAKNPSEDMAEMDLSLSTSAVNLALAFPLGKSGGMNFIGRVTYWDPFIQLAKLFFQEIQFVTRAPYIRSAALGASYDFSPELSLSANGFFGLDGIAAKYETTDFTWKNWIGFLTTALSYSPRQNILLRARVGGGYYQNEMNGIVIDEIGEMMSGDQEMLFSDSTANAQGRFDLDWDLGRGFVFSAGAEERYSRWERSRHVSRKNDNPLVAINILNQGLASSLYAILEYKTADRRFGLEAGIRGDHFLLTGEGFVLKGVPEANPRLNLNYSVLENKGIISALTLTAGTGLFSSVNSSLQNAGARNGIDPLEAIQNRSWNSVIGAKLDLSEGYSFILEGYVKRVFRRAYTKTTDVANVRQSDFFFDGEAFIWGFDGMLQKFNSRYWDGWISYSYIDAKYRDPQSADRDKNHGGWYYPGFHRFHTLNIIFNYKPVPAVQLMTRFSLASGIPVPRVVDFYHDESDPDPGRWRWRWELAYDDMSRTGVNMPLDIKLSLFGHSKNGRALRELYVSIENILSLVYTAEGHPDYDSATGERTSYHTIATYELPVPMLTFGVKWSY